MNAAESKDVRAEGGEAEAATMRREPPASLELSASADGRPALVVQSPKSPKTPTLSRKLKAISLDSEPARARPVRDVFSMPNTPKKLTARARDLFDPPKLGTNLKRFASNTSISGSQTLKTLPEIMMLQDFSSGGVATEGRSEPARVKAKGLLERRGSNASLTIDLGASPPPASTTTSAPRLNAAKSVSTLNLTSFGTCFTSFHQHAYKCAAAERKTDTCGNCTIYESIPSKFGAKEACRAPKKKCNCVCSVLGGRKSLSNENLYVPPCSLCLTGGGRHGARHCRGHRRACYPRQADLDAQSLSDDFKLHLQNVQYLQTAGSVLSVAELRACCELPRVPKLHQEFWEVPLNLQEKCIVSGSQTRNRYKGVLPNEHSRVHLAAPQAYIHANYIKGPDYAETAYVATQGPMAHTCADFWLMVWQTRCDCVVMLTQLVEKGRNKCELYFPLGKSATSAATTASTGNTLSRTTSSSSSSSSSDASSLSACSPAGKVSYYTIRTAPAAQPDRFTFGYATNNNHRQRMSADDDDDAQQQQEEEEEEVVRFEELDEVRFGRFRVAFVSLRTLGDVNMRVLRLVNLETQECRLVRHYWFAQWQDHKMADPAQVLRLAVHILQYLDARDESDATAATTPTPTSTDDAANANDDGDGEAKATALIVHCSAGIGRTGCFLAILNGIQQLRTNANVDVLAILCSLRLHRGGMVQTAEQYELIHRVLGLYAEQITLKH